jgi:nitroreductase
VLIVNVTQAIIGRTSCRAFTDRPVRADTVRSILETARRAPSGGNLQPWHVHVLGGERMREFRALIADKLASLPDGEGSEYNIYPPKLKDPYRSRRFKCGEDLYATIGIARDNRAGRLAQFAKNFDFFGAPMALFFSIDRGMGPDQWADVGMFMQSIMLLIHEHGLQSCPQEAWAVWPKTVGEFLQLRPELMLFCGMAVGHGDETAPINRLRTERAPLEDLVTFVGV